MRILRGVREIAADYSLFIVDLWGVMHNGIACYPAALDCLRQLKYHGKKIALLSNAPRRVEEVKARSAALGLDPALYDLAFSSGEMTWQYLQDAPLGRKAYPIMTGKDISLIEDTPIELCSQLSQSNFILCSGPGDDRPDLTDWLDMLAEAKARELPLLCANPDLVVHRGAAEEICAGTIAMHYEKIGGQVVYHGKPFPAIYRSLLEMTGSAKATPWIAFGDSFRTDIRGAKDAGGKSLFIAGGIHQKALLPDLNAEKLLKLSIEYSCRPNFVLDFLRW